MLIRMEYANQLIVPSVSLQPKFLPVVPVAACMPRGNANKDALIIIIMKITVGIVRYETVARKSIMFGGVAEKMCVALGMMILMEMGYVHCPTVAL
jgi:hypothetical protein